MMVLPLVSILLPVYQVEEYIERCARSVFEQTYQNLEYVFVDDGSTDDSINILQRILSDYPERKNHCKIIRHLRNKGLAATRNTAIDNSHGDFVFHVDADDWVEADAVESLVRKQQETGGDMIYTSEYYKHQKTKNKILCYGWSSERESLLANILEGKATICVWSKLIKHSLYTDNGIRCDEKGSFYEDYQILSRLVYFSHSIACLDACIYHYNRSNSNSLTTNLTKSIEIQKQGLRSIQSVLQFFQHKEHCYFDCVMSFYLDYVYKMLKANCRHRNKTAYTLFLNILRQTDKQYWNRIGWDSLWTRIIDKHYYIRLLVH